MAFWQKGGDSTRARRKEWAAHGYRGTAWNPGNMTSPPTRELKWESVLD